MFAKAVVLVASYMQGDAQPDKADPAAVAVTSDVKVKDTPGQEPEPVAPVVTSGSGNVGVGTAPAALASATPQLGLAFKLGGGPDAGKLVDGVQKYYRDTNSFSALFGQTYKNVAFGRERTSYGRLWVKKPGKMRWDYTKKSTKKVYKTFIADGSVLWGVEFDLKQYTELKLSKDVESVAVSFLLGRGNLKRDFNASVDRSGKYGKSSDYVVRLTPRRASAHYKRLFLVVDRGNYRVKESVVIEANDNINRYRFYKPKRNAGVGDSLFVFDESKYKNKFLRVSADQFKRR